MPPALLPDQDPRTPARIAASMRPVLEPDAVRAWFDEYARYSSATVTTTNLNRLEGWLIDPHTGDIRHRVGKFFTITGLAVDFPGGPVPRWQQPIIIQPEIGVLGILLKEIDGVLHCLMQAKVEPGNPNGLQLSPTVQATRSNYTRVHGGKPVPYLEYFVDARRVIADVRQSEQGSWFLQKRNRNMIVEIDADIEVLDGFRWMTLGDVHHLLTVDDVVNMDSRTVLSCLPFSGVYEGGGRREPLIRSCSAEEGSLHSMGEILSWITERRTRTEISTRTIPLAEVRGWYREPARIRHEDGLFFDVIGIGVTATGREVGNWMQPMLRPHGTGLVAFLVREIAGVLHVLVHARAEPGYVDVVELAPTVQCAPENYKHMPPPPYLDEVLAAGPERTRFSAVLSEEGGRFYHARTSYRVVETDLDPFDEPPDFRWLTVHQLLDLLRHSHYVNVQARTMITCLHGMVAGLTGERTSR